MTRRLLFGLAAVRLSAQSERDAGTWRALREQLLRDPTYFDVIRDSELPVNEGTVVAMEPATRPGTLLIGIETPLLAELQLQILRDGQPARIRTTPARKSKIRFHNTSITGWKKRPFLLTASVAEMDLDFEDVDGVGAK